jgi:hypothetical protein
MQIVSWISCALLAAATALAYQAPTVLTTEVIYSPPDCPQKATSGKLVNVHYVSTELLSRERVFYTKQRTDRDSAYDRC